MKVKVELTQTDIAYIAYLRDLMLKAVPDADTAMIVAPEGWVKHLTWALDKLEGR